MARIPGAEELAEVSGSSGEIQVPSHSEQLAHWSAVRCGFSTNRASIAAAGLKGIRFFRAAPSPEQLLAGEQDQQQVRSVLSAMRVRDAELLILRSEGLSYQEVAEVLGINETSIGTLFRRAQQAFRKEYVKRYGQPNA
jgi:RNA polymerase sigma-70 factor (ECF subfamily)